MFVLSCDIPHMKLVYFQTGGRRLVSLSLLPTVWTAKPVTIAPRGHLYWSRDWVGTAHIVFYIQQAFRRSGGKTKSTTALPLQTATDAASGDLHVSVSQPILSQRIHRYRHSKDYCCYSTSSTAVENNGTKAPVHSNHIEPAKNEFVEQFVTLLP